MGCGREKLRWRTPNSLFRNWTPCAGQHSDTFFKIKHVGAEIRSLAKSEQSTKLVRYVLVQLSIPFWEGPAKMICHIYYMLNIMYIYYIIIYIIIYIYYIYYILNVISCIIWLGAKTSVFFPNCFPPPFAISEFVLFVFSVVVVYPWSNGG